MNVDRDYIKDIEGYFLSSAGEGIMLSSKDYSLIADWKNRKIPKEIVLRGINKAVTGWKEKEENRKKPIRSLKYCVPYVEQSIIEHGFVLRESDRQRAENEHVGIVGELLERLGTLMGSAQGESKEYYKELRERISKINEDEHDNVISRIYEIEEDCLNTLFATLPPDARVDISTEAEDKVKARAKYMTNDAYNESVLSFRNEIIISKFDIKPVMSVED